MWHEEYVRGVRDQAGCRVGGGVLRPSIRLHTQSLEAQGRLGDTTPPLSLQWKMQLRYFREATTTTAVADLVRHQRCHQHACNAALIALSCSAHISVAAAACMRIREQLFVRTCFPTPNLLSNLHRLHHLCASPGLCAARIPFAGGFGAGDDFDAGAPLDAGESDQDQADEALAAETLARGAVNRPVIDFGTSRAPAKKLVECGKQAPDPPADEMAQSKLDMLMRTPGYDGSKCIDPYPRVRIIAAISLNNMYLVHGLNLPLEGAAFRILPFM